ncbi:GTP-binding protein (plasmid) [Pantoea sp. BJ2]|uniref:GTP-binding protein n=1 Tax=Pantoea sp. BJ2 TaxID=3141322 RepID=A0AAU7U4Z1_9GAMM
MTVYDGMRTFKVALIGDGGVGKTTFIKRFLNAELEKSYHSITSSEIHPVTFNTNSGEINFEVWDTSGQEKYGRLKDSYYINTHCAIIMWDLLSERSSKNVEYWHRDLVRICENIPIVAVGNKLCLLNDSSSSLGLSFLKKKNIKYYDVCAKSNYNVEKPFLWLAQRLLSNPNLEFIEKYILAPSETTIDPTFKSERERRLIEWEGQSQNLDEIYDVDE